MRTASDLAKSRGSTVKIRRNSHYGESPIAYPLNMTLLFSWAMEKRCDVFFAYPSKGTLYFQEATNEKSKGDGCYVGIGNHGAGGSCIFRLRKWEDRD